MKKYTLKRSDGQDLIFNGELLSSAAGKPMGCQERLKWTEIELYKTENGTYIVVVLTHALWQEEERVVVCEDAEDILATLDVRNRDEGKDNLSIAAKKALEEAAEKDQDIYAAFYKEKMR